MFAYKELTNKRKLVYKDIFYSNFADVTLALAPRLLFAR